MFRGLWRLCGIDSHLLRRDVCWGFILMDSSEYEGAVGVGSQSEENWRTKIPRVCVGRVSEIFKLQHPSTASRPRQ